MVTKSIKFVTDEKGLRKGSALVEMHSKTEAQDARQLHGMIHPGNYNDRPLRIEDATTSSMEGEVMIDEAAA